MMNEMLQYISDNPSINLLIFAMIAGCVFVYYYSGGKGSEAAFKDLDLSKVKFREKGASGYSRKSIITEFGGASGLLDVIVTDTELYIKGTYPALTHIGTFNDLTRRVNLSDIRDGVRLDKLTFWRCFFRNRVRLSYCSFLVQ